MDSVKSAMLELQTWQIIASIAAVFICTVNAKRTYKFISETLELRKSHKKVVSEDCHWFWGHALKFGPYVEGITNRWNLMKKFPKVHLMRYGPIYTAVSCFGPSIIGPILNNAKIPKSKINKKIFSPWIGDGLLVSSGKKWKRNRKLLTPAFHFEILKNYVHIFNESVDVMISKFREAEDPIEIFQPVSMMALDNMLRCTMSYESDCQLLGETHPYVRAIYDICDAIVQRIYYQPLGQFDFFFGFTEAGKKFKAAIKTSHNQTTAVIQERIRALKDDDIDEIKNKKKKDFLDILILARDTNGKGLSEHEIRDEVETFLFEGHDTTASGMAWILFDLATHPEHQSKCREEIEEILKDRENVEWEDLSKLNYLTLCIKESMRIHPPVPYCLARSLEEPLKFNKDFGKDQLNATTTESADCSHVFPKDTKLELPILMLHHNPNVWEEPEKFDPSRFKPENYSKLPHFAYIPFSAGPRNCIGQNFAMIEIKITISKILRNFEIYVDETCTKPSIASILVLRSKTGIHLRFKSLLN